MTHKKFSFSISSIFGHSALSDQARDRFEVEIQSSAARAGFVHVDQTPDGERLFKRKSDGATVTMPKKEALRRRDQTRLHGFDGYL